jgi:hypothetical protein
MREPSTRRRAWVCSACCRIAVAARPWMGCAVASILRPSSRAPRFVRVRAPSARSRIRTSFLEVIEFCGVTSAAPTCRFCSAPARFRSLWNHDPRPLVERSVDLVVVREESVPRGVTCWSSLTGPVARPDHPDLPGAVADLSVEGWVAPPDVPFLRSPMRRANELPREPAATGEPVAWPSVNDSAVPPELVESVTESCGCVPEPVEKR